jgi:3-phenylpropionate/trans-cinnamate dioxygenase ferredoxin subunit
MQSDPSQDDAGYQFVEVLPAADLPPGERIVFEVNDTPVVLFNVGGRFFAIGDICSHDQGPLGDGEIDRMEIICPRHGARFDLSTGRATQLPAVASIPSYPVRIMDGIISVGIK